MRAFITGIAGFVGYHLAEHLRAEGDVVWGSSQETSSEDRLAWDIAQPVTADLVARLAEFAPTVFYHLAAISKSEDCGLKEMTPEAIAVNVEGTRHVLEMAARLPGRPRVVFISSSHVYSEDDSLTPVAESAPLAPVGGYGQSKFQAEALVRQFVASSGVDGVIARAFQHTGPRQIPRYMLPEWCQQFARGISPVVIRNSEAWIDLSDVRDVVRAYRLLAQRGEPGEAYNVGRGTADRTGDVFEALRKLADPQRPFQVAAPKTKRGPIADLSKISAATGWRPQLSQEQTIRDTYEWFLRAG